MSTYRIAEVADRSGFTPATLRYYEDIGLVRPAGRTDAGYRLYDDDSLTRLRFIARAKQLGCTLDEIAELSQVWDGGRCAPLQERLRATVAAKVVESRRQIAELTVLTADLQRAAAGLAVSATGACDDTCGCLTDGPSGGAGDGPSDERAVARAVPLLDLAGADSGRGHGCGRLPRRRVRLRRQRSDRRRPARRLHARPPSGGRAARRVDGAARCR